MSRMKKLGQMQTRTCSTTELFTHWVHAAGVTNQVQGQLIQLNNSLANEPKVYRYMHFVSLK